MDNKNQEKKDNRKRKGRKFIFIVALETDKDHCHLFLNALPNYSLSDIMAKIKEGQVKC